MSAEPGPRSFEVVLEWIEERILSGELGVGDQLPAERDLAARLGVGRPAVREAVRTLQAQGVLRSTVGAGAAGGTSITAVSGRALVRLLRLHVALANFGVNDVLDARVALERLSVRLACTQATPEQLTDIRAQLLAMDASRHEKAVFNDYDTAFHAAIAEAAGNRLVSDLTVAIRESMRVPLLASFQHVENWDALVDKLQDDHTAICAAVESGDANSAEQLIERHIRSAWALLEPGTAD